MGALPIIRELPPIQTELIWIEGSPEGSYEAPAGFFVIDWTTGNWYRKTTPVTQNTGWVVVTTGGSGGGNIIGMGDPTGIAPDGAIYTDRLNGNQWYYDALSIVWVQNIGST